MTDVGESSFSLLPYPVFTFVRISVCVKVTVSQLPNDRVLRIRFGDSFVIDLLFDVTWFSLKNPSIRMFMLVCLRTVRPPDSLTGVHTLRVLTNLSLVRSGIYLHPVFTFKELKLSSEDRCGCRSLFPIFRLTSPSYEFVLETRYSSNTTGTVLGVHGPILLKFFPM